MTSSFLKLTGSTCALVAVLGLAAAMAATATPATGCKPGTTCLKVQANGKPGGTFTAQCTGTFPDFIMQSNRLPPAGEPFFVLSQSYPATAPTGDAPWLAIDFKNGVTGANDYLKALRDYAFDGMIAADFRPENNTVRQWFHMPLMNFADGRREPIHGVTKERGINGKKGELGLKKTAAINNYAVGFYNAAGGATIGNVWKSGHADVTKSTFAPGTMTFKILFTDAKPTDFVAGDLLAGAPQWTIQTTTGPTTVRLLQMDVSANDPRSPTGWVFGTYAFEKSATDTPAWLRLRPVGLSWGNDPGFTPADQKAGKKLMESTISDQIPAYAKAHLGWAGRTNGPVDNPLSGCLSCHGTAQFPRVADLGPFIKPAACNTDAKRLLWFRDFPGSAAFGAVNAACMPTTITPAPVSLDFSLQMQVAAKNMLTDNMTNPCAPAVPAVVGGAPEKAVAPKAPPVPGLQGSGPIQR
jgi:hypothetical protein